MKPILFNTDMVRAILEDRKTVTRRVVKPQPFEVKQDENASCWCGHFVSESGKVLVDKLPYHPGDILYVRETWRSWRARLYEAEIHIEFKAGGEGSVLQFQNRKDYDNFFVKWGVGTRWHPSIHMPREAARIFLRVTDITVERLQEIGVDGAIKEGIKNSHIAWKVMTDFVDLWNSTIKPQGRAIYGWEANPWVWVIEFERISKEEAIKRG